SRRTLRYLRKCVNWSTPKKPTSNSSFLTYATMTRQRNLGTRKWKTSYRVIAGLICLLIVIRLLLPTLVLRYANHTLANLDGYYGQVADIDIALYRGAYQLEGFYLNKVDSASGDQTRFFAVKEIDLSIEWPSLLRGA